MKKKIIAALLAGSMVMMSACGTDTADTASVTETQSTAVESTESTESTEVAETVSTESQETDTSTVAATTAEERAYIEETLNLKNMEGQEWTYSSDADAWTLSVVTAVAYPEIEDEQGVSVCVPGAYVTGIDTDGDGKEDVTSDDATDSVKGSLVLDYDAEITSSNGQTYTAASAPCILNTGAAGYSEQQNQTASTEYAGEGYINIACGNRGKQSKLTDPTPRKSQLTGKSTKSQMGHGDVSLIVPLPHWQRQIWPRLSNIPLTRTTPTTLTSRRNWHPACRKSIWHTSIKRDIQPMRQNLDLI